MSYWFDLDTFVLAIATLLVFIVLWGWHTDPMVKFDIKEVVMDSKTGRVSLMKIGQFTALLVSTWVLIHETREKRLSEWLFVGYMVAWSGANLARRWIDSKASGTAEKVGSNRSADERE